MVDSHSIYFNEEHVLLRKMIRDFSNDELKPLAQDIDKNSTFPEESIKKIADLGLMGIPWDEKYGGNNMDTLSLVIAIEEIGKVCPSTAATMMAHTSLGTGPIAIFGTDEQKEKYLPDLASGKMLGAFGLTEPNAGSDAGNTQTRAVANTDGLVGRVIAGVFVGNNGSEIVLKTEDGSEYNVHLNAKFSSVLRDLEKLAKEEARIVKKEDININLVNVKVLDNDIYMEDDLSSYFVIEPSWLINVTALQAFDFCGRSLFNDRFSLARQNEYMMRGSIVHEVFEKVLKDPGDRDGLKHELSESFDSRGLEFGLLGSNHNDMKENLCVLLLKSLG